MRETANRLAINSSKLLQEKNLKLKSFTAKILMAAFLFTLLAISQQSFATVTVTYTGTAANTTFTAGSPYATMAAAVTAMNSSMASTTGAGSVIFTENANETAPAGTGYYITATGSATVALVIDGGGKTFTAGANSAGGMFDAVFKIVGGDYITIQNCVIQENTTSNTVFTTGATNTMTEAGILLIHASATDGASNNTIQNNTISLSAFPNTCGILSTSSSTTTNASPGANTTADATSSAGTNSNNKFYNNIISTVQYGINLICPPITATVNETGNDIGGTSYATGNRITFGGTSTTTGPWNRSSSSVIAGILYRNGAGFSARYNVVTSSNIIYTSHSAGLCGIAVSSGTTPTGVTYNMTISNNVITLNQAATSAAANPLYGIDFGHGISTGTIAGSNNNITINQTSSVANSGAVIAIKASYASATNTCNSDTILINQNNSAAANASAVTGITGAGVGTTVSITNSIITLKQDVSGTGSFGAGGVTYISVAAASGTANVTGNTLNTTGSVLRTTGTKYLINHGGSFTTALNVNNNNANVDASGASSGTIYGTYSASATALSSGYNLNSNTINIVSASSGTTYGMYNDDGGNPVKNYNNNNITISGSGAIVYGIQADYGTNNIGSDTFNLSTSAVTPTLMAIQTTANYSTTLIYNITNNVINTLSASGAGASAPTVTGINILYTTATNTISGNKITGITTGAGSGSANITGINISAGTTSNVFKNKIYDLATSCTGTSTSITGIKLLGGTTNNIYNNYIGQSNAFTGVNVADAAVRGIYINATTTSAENVYYNTIYLNTSSTGTNFGTAGLYHTYQSTATFGALNMRNNIIVNKSTKSGTGLTVAFERSAVNTTWTNFVSTSNNNLFYAGTPSATNVIFLAGVTPAQTLANYQSITGLSPRETASVTENPPFLSTSGSTSNYLHIDPTATTIVESGAANIATYTDDYDADIRQGNAGYPAQSNGGGTAPDIGADEVDAHPAKPSITLNSITPNTNQCTASSRAISVNVTTPSGTITGVTITYNNGAAVGPVAMTNASGTTWTYTIPAASPTNTVVTWSITATNSSSLTTTYTGATYQDDPNNGLTATATAKPTTVCSGGADTLSVVVSKSSTVTLGAGGTTGSSYDAVFYHLFGGLKSQFLVKASELTALGLSAGNITALGINMSTVTTQSYTGFAVNIASVGSTANLTSTLISSGLSQVYASATSYTPTTGINTFTFGTGSGSASSFNWDGTSNILIQFCWSNNNGGGTSNFAKIDATGFTSCAYYRVDNTAPATLCAVTAGTGTTTNRPQFIFTGNASSTPTAYSWKDAALTVVGTTNPSYVTPSTSPTTSYTCTTTVNGCSLVSNTVNVTVNTLPTAPTRSISSNQCGTAVPAVSVSDPNGYTTPTYKWYASNVATTPLQSSTSTTYTSTIASTTIFYVSVVNPTTGCESARTSDTAYVNSPDAVTAYGGGALLSGGSTTPSAICANTAINLYALQTGSTNTYTYSWAANTTTGSGISGSPLTGQNVSVTPTAAGTYTYTVTANDGVAGCTTTSNVTLVVNAAPAITVNPTSPGSLCLSGNTSLSVTGTGSLQWKSSATIGGTYNNVATNDANTGVSYTGATTNTLGINGITNTYYYECVASSSGCTSAVSTPATVTVVNPSITGTTPAAICGTGTVGLSATGSAGTTLRWYSALTGGTLLATGTSGSATGSYTTPSISTTTTYYVSSFVPSSGNAVVGAGATTSATYPNPLYSNWANQKQQVLFTAADLQAANLVAGNLTSLALNLTSTSTTTRTGFTIKLATTAATALTTTYLTPTFTQVYTGNYVPATGTNTFAFGTGAGSSSTFNWDGTSNLLMEICWDNTASTATEASTATADNTSYVSVVSYNRTSTTGTPVCGLTVTGSTTYSVRPRYTFAGQTSSCTSSPRTAVVATINTPPTITPTGTATICSGANASLNVTSSNDPNYKYIWIPGTLNGAAQTPSPSSTQVYTVTATDTTSGSFAGCSTSGTVTVTVLPASVTATAGATSFCASGSTTISLSPSTGFGAGTIQWQVSNDGTTWRDTLGNVTSISTGTRTITTYYHAIVKNSLGANCITSNDITLTINNPAITGTTPASNCGAAAITLSANGSAGSTIKWYSALTGGTLLATGTAGAGTGSYTTPTISTTTTYYAEASTAASGTATLGTAGTTLGASSSGGATPFGQYYEGEHAQYLVTAADLAATGLSSGNITALSFFVTAKNSTKPYTSYSIKLATTTATSLTGLLSPTFTTVYTGATTLGTGYSSVAGANNFTFSTPFNWNGTSNVLVDICFANDPGAAGTYYSNSDVVRGTTKSYTATYSIWDDDASYCAATTGTNSGSSAVLPDMVFTGQVACAGSPRTAVTATISSAPSIVAAGTATICNGSGTALSVSSSNAGYNYSWTPTPTVSPTSGTPVTATPLATTKYYVNAIDASGGVFNGCTAVDSVTVTVLPSAATATAAATSFCGSGSTTISLSPSTGFGTGTVQWQVSNDGTTWRDTLGNVTSISTGTRTITTYYHALIKTGATTCVTSNTATVTINNPTILTTTPASSCGAAAVTLSATATAGTTLKWYSALTGGTLLSTGTAGAGTGSYTTPTISSTTTYYVGAEVPAAGSGVVGAGATTIANDYPNPFYSLWSHSQEQILIKASELQAAGLTAGNITGLSLNVTAGTTIMPDFSLAVASYANSNTSLTTLLTSGFTSVYTNATGLTPVVGTNTITFSTPFNWDGTSHIVLKFCWGNSGSSATQNNTVTGDATSYVCSVNAHNSSATSGSSICGSSTVYLTYSSRPKFTFFGQAACIGTPRQAVTATISTAPSITATGNNTICSSNSSTLNVTSSNAGYGYVWTPGSLTGTPQTVAPTSTTTYVVTATDASGGAYNGCVARDTVRITVLPTSVTAVPANSSICGSGGTVISLTPSSGYGNGKIEWESSPDNVTWSSLGSNSSSFITGSLLTNTYFHALIKDTSGAVCTTSNSTFITVNNPIIASTKDSVRCSSGVFGLSATGSSGTTLKWYASTTGKTVLTTGTSYTTPSLSATTTYYVEAVSGTSTSGSTNVGDGVSTGTGAAYNPTNGGYGGIKGQYLFTAAELLASGLSAGNITNLALEYSAAGSVLSGFNIQIGTTALTTFGTPVSIEGSLTTSYTAATYTPTVGVNNFLLSTPFNWDGTSNIIVSTSWSNNNTSNTSSTVLYDATTNYASQSYRKDNETSANMLSFTGSTGSGTYTYDRSQSRPKITFSGQVACASSPRTPVTAIIATPTTTPTVPSTQTICNDSVVTLTATGSTNSTVVNIFNEDFNGSLTGWTKSNSGSNAGTPASSNWKQQAAGYYYYTYDPIYFDDYYFDFFSNDTSSFILSNSDAQGGSTTNPTNSFYTSPTFSTAGFASASLTFYHNFVHGDNDSAVVQISTDGGTSWSNIAKYTTTQGRDTLTYSYYDYYYDIYEYDYDENMVPVTIDISSYVNSSTVKLRFKYSHTYDWWWAIDNVSIKGVKSVKYAWTPKTGLYTNILATTPYAYDSITTPDAPTVYAKPTDTITYKAIAYTDIPTSCSGSNTVTVNVSKLPTATLDPVKLYVCDGSAALSASAITPASSTLTWSVVSGSGTISSPSANPTTVTSLTSGTSIIQLKATNGGCVDKPIGKDTIVTPSTTSSVIATSPSPGVAVCNYCVYADGNTKTYYNSNDGKIIATIEDETVSSSNLAETQMCFKVDGSVQSVIDNLGNTEPFLQRVWTIHPANGTNAKVTLYFTNAELIALQAAANSGPYQFSGYDLWITKYSGGQDGNFITPASPGGVYVPATFSAYGSDHQVQFEVSSFSTFYIHPNLFPFSALPVEFVSFTGWNTGNANQLEWKTASELNTLKFVVEKSTDGSHFSYIGEKAAAGNSNQLLTYDFIDNEPVIGNNYYRLKIIDLDGTYTYSNVVNIPVKEATSNNFTRVYPNPTGGNLNVEIQSIAAYDSKVIVYDIIGNKMYEKTASLVKGLNTLQFDFSSFAKGAYILHFTDNTGNTHTTKFVKE